MSSFQSLLRNPLITGAKRNPHIRSVFSKSIKPNKTTTAAASRYFGGRALKSSIHMDDDTCSSTTPPPPPPPPPRGSLIVLEGLDRSGKTSQCARLVSHLQDKEGLPVEAWRFPDRTTCVGSMIAAYLANQSQLDDRAIHLLFSANRWEKRVLMESKLKSGTSLVVDRYSYSGVAFSAAKGLDIEWCKAPEVGLIAPDLVLFLDVPPEKAAERGGYGTERYEQLEFQKEVAKHYNLLRDPTWEVVDGSLPLEAVEEQIRRLTMETIVTCQKGKPLANLWLSN
ncbi:thymidylate kinase [Iris pallida]|uniref:Thymidylate kinase n=1 Tax=Iris pallida TaxID=29817 RepID=A0AAX6GRK3_IRIPA|nr:thymidylate kinase [Iris pallida]